MVKKIIKEDGVAPAAVNAVGAGGMGSTSQGAIQGYDPLMQNKKKKLRDIVRRKPV